MKKSLRIALMAILAMSAALWGQTITVTSPTAGSVWCRGGALPITWTKSGIAQDMVFINLMNAGNPSGPEVAQITASTDNDGSFSWMIPYSLAPGDYFIRVRTLEATVFGDSPVFKIKYCMAKITLTEPINNSEWCRGGTYAITWTQWGAMPGNVQISLYPFPKGDITTGLIDITTRNDGSFDWPIPDSLAEGVYYIRIKTIGPDPDVCDDSPGFEIKSCTSVDSSIYEKLSRLFYYIRIPGPSDPDPWWTIDISRFVEEFDKNPFAGSFFLLKNGQKLQELGRFGAGKAPARTLKFKLSEANAGALKNRGAKFSLGIFNAKGEMILENALESMGHKRIR